jgi:hypothetical protein
MGHHSFPHCKISARLRCSVLCQNSRIFVDWARKKVNERDERRK